jgi:hypothetical protein
MPVCLALGFAVSAEAADDAARNIYEGTLESRVSALASIQPGLGVVMHEMGYRFANAYWAANGGNWGLAQYQLKESLEAQEVAEMTRPQRAPTLKVFESSYLEPLAKAIENKDIIRFNRSFSAAVKGCNACHTALGYGFIRYHVPKQSKQELLDFAAKTEPKYEEAKEAK